MKHSQRSFHPAIRAAVLPALLALAGPSAQAAHLRQQPADATLSTERVSIDGHPWQKHTLTVQGRLDAALKKKGAVLKAEIVAPDETEATSRAEPSARLTATLDGQPVLAPGTAGGSGYRFVGVCNDTAAKSLAVLFETWTGAAGNGSRVWAASYSPASKTMQPRVLLDKAIDDYAREGTDLVTCTGDEHWRIGDHWAKDATVPTHFTGRVCECAFAKSIERARLAAAFRQTLHVDDKHRDFDGSAAMRQGGVAPIPFHDVSVTDADLQAFVKHVGKTHGLETFASSTVRSKHFMVRSVAYQEGSRADWGALFYKEKAAPRWHLASFAPGQGKALTEPRACSIEGDKLVASICIAGCGSPAGERRLAEFDLTQATMRLLAKKSRNDECL